MRPIAFAVAFVLLPSTGVAQAAAGLSAGFLFSGAPGVEASCGNGRALSADAWVGRPVTPSGSIRAQLAARWVRPFNGPCEVYANLPSAAPMPIRPDGVYTWDRYGSPWFGSGFGTVEGRLQLYPWPAAEVGPRLTTGGGWAWRVGAADQPFLIGGAGLGFAVGGAQVVWDLEIWWMRVERETITETWLDFAPVTWEISATSHVWQRAVALRITLEDLF